MGTCDIVQWLHLLADDVPAFCEQLRAEREERLDLQPADFGGEVFAGVGVEFGGHGGERIRRAGDHFQEILEFHAGGVGIARLVERLGQPEAGEGDMLPGGRRVLQRQPGGARAGGAGPGGVVFGQIGLEILDRLAGIARLLDRTGLAEQDVIAELARQFHRQRLGIKRVGLGEIRLGRVGNVGVRFGFEFFGEAQDFAHQRLLAVRGEDAGGLGLVDRRRRREILLFDERLGFQKHRLVAPGGLGKVRQQLIRRSDGGGELLGLQQRRGFQEQRLVGGGVLGRNSLIRQHSGLVEIAGPQFRLDRCERGRFAHGGGRGEDECPYRGESGT